jgi:endonuclease-8
MPEGDTIFRAARTLHRALAGKVVTRFDSMFPALTRIADGRPIVGRRIEAVTSRGKHLLIAFSDDLTLQTHMRMNGSWHIYRIGERWQRPARDMRIVVGTDDFVAVGFNIPVAALLTGRQLARHEPLRSLGPDLLSTDAARPATPAPETVTPEAVAPDTVAPDTRVPDTRAPDTRHQSTQHQAPNTKHPIASTHARAVEILRRMRTHDREPIANVLLNQRVVAGVGNVLKSEILFVAGIYPFRAVATLSDDELLQVIDVSRQLLQANVMIRAQTLSPSIGRRTTRSLDPNVKLWVYSRGGKPCRRCGARINSRKTGLDARLTYWCPRCQPE